MGAQSIASDSDHGNQGSVMKEVRLDWVMKNEISARLREWTTLVGRGRDEAERCPRAGGWTLLEKTTEHPLVAEMRCHRPVFWQIYYWFLLQQSSTDLTWHAFMSLLLIYFPFWFLCPKFRISHPKFLSTPCMQLEEVIWRKEIRKEVPKKILFFFFVTASGSLVSAERTGLWVLGSVVCC